MQATWDKFSPYIWEVAGLLAIIALALMIVHYGRALLEQRARALRQGRGGQPRLGLVESIEIDVNRLETRQLALVRRDNVVHLVMVGGPSDLLIETNINLAGAATMPDRRGRAASTTEESAPVPMPMPAPAPVVNAPPSAAPVSPPVAAPAPPPPAAVAPPPVVVSPPEPRREEPMVPPQRPAPALAPARLPRPSQDTPAPARPTPAPWPRASAAPPKAPEKPPAEPEAEIVAAEKPADAPAPAVPPVVANKQPEPPLSPRPRFDFNQLARGGESRAPALAIDRAPPPAVAPPPPPPPPDAPASAPSLDNLVSPPPASADKPPIAERAAPPPAPSVNAERRIPSPPPPPKPGAELAPPAAPPAVAPNDAENNALADLEAEMAKLLGRPSES